jgi:multidrug transporter EmrE-like cation transporter
MPVAHLAIAILAEVLGTSALKASNGFTAPLPSLLVVTSYSVSFYSLSLALRTIPVGVAYAIWSGVGIVLISSIAWVIYRQALDLAAIVGIGLIIAGVVVIQLFSTTVRAGGGQRPRRCIRPSPRLDPDSASILVAEAGCLEVELHRHGQPEARSIEAA